MSIEPLEKLEDTLYVKTQLLGAEEKRVFLKLITAKTALLTAHDFVDQERTFLMSIGESNLTEISCERTSLQRDQLAEKIRKTASCETCESWAIRCLYSLLLDDTLVDETTYISDQMEIVFNAAHFCKIPVNLLEENIEFIWSKFRV